MRERLGHGADFALARVDATDDQRKRVDAILDQSAPQLFAVMERGAKLRKEVIDAVASGNHAAAETARKQVLAWADEASRLWLSTIEQSLAVLDTAQREKVREHLKRFGDHGPGHDRGAVGAEVAIGDRGGSVTTGRQPGAPVGARAVTTAMASGRGGDLAQRKRHRLHPRLLRYG